MPLLEAVIKNLDSTAPRTAEIRTFPLTNADATQTATVLSQLFGLTGTATTANQRSASYTLVTTQPAGDGSVTATLGTAEQYALRVTVDTRTNTLLIGGTKQYVDLAEKVIQELDSSTAQERQTMVYRLHNARATDVQTAVQSWLTAETNLWRTNLGTTNLGSVQRLLETQVAVVAVPNEGVPANTNTLLISASPRYFKFIADIIKELDQPPPQVLVQVLLAEVTLNDDCALGMEWTYTRTRDGKTVTAGTNFGVAADFASGGGFNVSVTGGDLAFFLRALQNNGRLEVLSRPQVLASDNQLAHLNIGQRVPFVSNSRIDTNGNVLNTIEYRDVGIILDMTPRISPNGSVKMVIHPEVSSIATSTVAISTGLNATIFNTREATTTVTVQDGHTIIIGGLITTKDEDTVKKVPLAGDIPFLGNLFKTTKKVKERTELLIILTPRIITSVASSDSLTEEERKTLKLMRGIKRDVTKDTIFTPLEGLAPRGNGATSLPSQGQLNLELNPSTTRPFVPPRRAPEKEYE
jgi:type II secretion system protein D